MAAAMKAALHAAPRFLLAQVAPAQQPRLPDDLGDQLLLPVGHDMHAADALDLAHLLDDLDAYALAFLPLPARRCALQSTDDLIRNHDAGDMRPHPLGGFGRAQRPNADQNKSALVQ